MASLLLIACVSAVVVAQGTPPVQARPDFSGSWTMVQERSESPSQYPDAAGPVTVIVAQTDKTVTIETTRGTLKSRASYVFSAEPAPPPTGTGTPVGRASFDGNALVLEGTRVIRGQTVSTRETRTLSADGSEMTVDTVLLVQHGYSFRGGKNYGTARDVFRRTVPSQAAEERSLKSEVRSQKSEGTIETRPVSELLTSHFSLLTSGCWLLQQPANQRRPTNRRRARHARE